MGVSIAEQETSISFTRDSNVCTIYTSDLTMMTILDKKVEKSENWKLIKKHFLNGELVGKTYETHKHLISFRNRFREMSEEQLKQLSDRARKNFHGIDQKCDEMEETCYDEEKMAEET